MNNSIERCSVWDTRHVTPDPIAVSDWFRRREGRPDWHRTARRLDYSGRLGGITLPTLVLCGRHDPQYQPACSMQLADGIPRAELAWFPRSGHYPHAEEPAAFWRIVDGFLSRPPPAAATAASDPRGAGGRD